MSDKIDLRAIEADTTQTDSVRQVAGMLRAVLQEEPLTVIGQHAWFLACCGMSDYFELAQPEHADDCSWKFADDRCES